MLTGTDENTSNNLKLGMQTISCTIDSKQQDENLHGIHQLVNHLNLSLSTAHTHTHSLSPLPPPLTHPSFPLPFPSLYFLFFLFRSFDSKGGGGNKPLPTLIFRVSIRSALLSVQIFSRFFSYFVYVTGQQLRNYKQNLEERGSLRPSIFIIHC